MHPKLGCSDIHQLCSTSSLVAVTCDQELAGILKASSALEKADVTQTEAGWEKGGDTLSGEAGILPGRI